MFRYSGIFNCYCHALGQLRQFLCIIGVFLIFCGLIGIFEKVLEIFPAVFSYLFSGNLENHAITGKFCFGGVVNMLLGSGAEQTVSAKEKYLHFTLRNRL